MNKLRIPLLLLLLLGTLLFSTIPASAQVKITPAIQAQINAELQKRGITESELRMKLLQNGIDPDNIPVDQLPNYKDRVIKIIEELQAEKKKKITDKLKSSDDSTHTDGTGKTRNGMFGKYKVGERGDTFLGIGKSKEDSLKRIRQMKFLADSIKRVADLKMKKDSVKIYGHNLFVDQTLGVFRTTDGAQAPETYVLGEGDEIRITIFGASQTDIQQRVNAEGFIQPTGTSKIFLKGVSLAQAREMIRERLSSAYSFRSDQFAVTIMTTRNVLVNVFGETKITGGFSVSALNSAFNVLSAAGGPTMIGSVRNIQLIRGNNKRNVDLYAFMNDPSIQSRYDLQQNDILYVPVATLLTTIVGAVQRPMTYEMLPTESLTDLIRYAGGLNRDVYPDFIQVQRYTNGEQRLMEWNLEDVRSGKVIVTLQNGDSVRIKSIKKPMMQYVQVQGSVYYPGKYDLGANPTLSGMLELAKPNYQARTDILFLKRSRSDESVEVLTIPFPTALNSTGQYKLQARDTILVLNQVTYRDADTISVNGQVRMPFQKAFSVGDHLTVKQAIDLAGGVKKSVYPVAYIFRKDLLNPTKMEYIRVDLNKGGEIRLQPGDKLNVYDNSTYTNIGEVQVSGAVKTPHGYTFDATLTLRDVFTTSGGFVLGAAYNRIEVFRTILSPTEKVRLERITLEVDSAFQIKNNPGFTLQPYDHIVVRLTPEFTVGQYVEITGQVPYPGVYVLENQEVSLSEVIKMAGGLLPNADPIGSKMFRTYRNRGNITMNVQKAVQNQKNQKFDPVLFDGDVININRRENMITILETGTRIAQFSVNQDQTGYRSLVYQGNHSAKWYINHYAGGFDKKTNKNSVTVTLPNDQMICTRKIFFIRKYPLVPSGSIISMQLDPLKEEDLSKKEKTNWDSIWARSLSATTALFTLLILSKQL